MGRGNNESNGGGAQCGVRNKYAKPWKEKLESSYFQLCTTYTKPGLVSIFYNEDQRSFHNWGLEVGSGLKRGRIREAIDHQINAPVLEIAGDHDGSVYMVCPPDPSSTINVDMPYLTILMKDMHGYSSVEFTVLDSLGFSRKICAKNFKAGCTIGELNCEIPMRLSPTWNYACVNFDETLRNAFGTKLRSVQRIKVNANVRVRRIYFHDEVFSFKKLPQEFRIKLVLTPQEKEEIFMYEEFLNNIPVTSPERNIPWSMPRLMFSNTLEVPDDTLRMSTTNSLHTALRRKVEIMEVPMIENDPDKYPNIAGKETTSNAGLLREMLHKSIPPSKLLLPTLSLIYPDNRGYEEAVAIQSGKVDDYLKKKGQKENKFFGRGDDPGGISYPCEGISQGVDERTENLLKMKKCIEVPGVVEVQSEHGNSTTGPPTHELSDWERFHMPTSLSQSDRSRHHVSEPEQQHGDDHHHHHHHHHHHSHGCGIKYTVADLAQYVKHRETFGDYDMFTGKLGNRKFLHLPGGDAAEDDGSDSDKASSDHTVESFDDLYTDAATLENPFVPHQRNSGSSRKSSRIMNHSRQSTNGRNALQDPAKYVEGDNNSFSGDSNTESWLLTWAYNGVSWTHTRDLNQQLLNDARVYYAKETEVTKKNRKSIMDVGISLHHQKQPQQPQQQQQVAPSVKYQRGQQKLPAIYRWAVPVLPRVMKEELRGTGGYYDIIVDNPTLPIERY